MSAEPRSKPICPECGDRPHETRCEPTAGATFDVADTTPSGMPTARGTEGVTTRSLKALRMGAKGLEMYSWAAAGWLVGSGAAMATVLVFAISAIVVSAASVVLYLCHECSRCHMASFGEGESCPKCAPSDHLAPPAMVSVGHGAQVRDNARRRT